jgi:hypothetical protein
MCVPTLQFYLFVLTQNLLKKYSQTQQTPKPFAHVPDAVPPFAEHSVLLNEKTTAQILSSGTFKNKSSPLLV